MKIVLAVDGSDQSYYAARALEHLTRLEQVVVLHAMDIPAPAYPMVKPEVAREVVAMTERRLREEGERVLKFVTTILPTRTGPVTTRLETGRPAELVLKAAEEEQAAIKFLVSKPFREAVEVRVLGKRGGQQGIAGAGDPARGRVHEAGSDPVLVHRPRSDHVVPYHAVCRGTHAVVATRAVRHGGRRHVRPGHGLCVYPRRDTDRIQRQLVQRTVPRERWAATPVSAAMIPCDRVRVVNPDTPIPDVLEAMDRDDVNRVSVTRAGRLLGMITHDRLLQIVRTHMELEDQAA